MIALATAQLARGLDHDLDILSEALDAIGQPWQIVDWDDASVDWSAFSIVVLRSTWDYYKRLDEFTRWINATAQVTQLYNPAEIVHWNLDKAYLLCRQRSSTRLATLMNNSCNTTSSSSQP
jgi:hypothetical protein